jgi:uncharacterized protein
VSQEKLNVMKDLLRSWGPSVVAYSGGVDSVFLAHVAREVLGDRMIAAIADSPSLPRRELEESLQLARRFGFPVRVVQTREFENPRYLANPEDRCYFCKHELFSELAPLARELGFASVLYGENASDVGDHRPGARAACEFQVHAPLKQVGLTKDEIRALSAQRGLPTSEKPQMACLSSRIPHGEPVTREKLGMIESAENFLRDLGFFDVRVRHHELPSPHSTHGRASRPPSSFDVLAQGVRKLEVPGTTGGGVKLGRHLARIEVGFDELPRVVGPGVAQRIHARLSEIGYQHVTLDLAGYRRGGGRGDALVTGVEQLPIVPSVAV